MNENTVNLKHKGRFGQTFIYLGKLFRMFVFQSDWKVLPMAAVITTIVGIVVAENLNVTMEGTTRGAFALSCICIWNGFFNSIQVVCRERAIVKREHRSGLHMSSYIAAHVIYQACLCAGQSVIMMFVLRYMKCRFGDTGIVTNSALADYCLTLFLITLSADMISLFVSCIVRNPTTAMTIVPFMLIFQLVFAGTFFTLPKKLEPLENATPSHWGINSLCSQGSYNDLKMTSVWTTLKKMKNVRLPPEKVAAIIEKQSAGTAESLAAAQSVQSGLEQSVGDKPIEYLIDYIEDHDLKDPLQEKCGQQNQNEAYVSTAENITSCWTILILIGAVFAMLSVIALEFIDRDKR